MINAYREVLARVPRRLSHKRTYLQAASDFLLLAFIYWAREEWLLTLCLVPVACFRSFSMMHECVHSAAHGRRQWNNVLGRIYGILCFLPFESWREVHLKHHLWTGNVEQDPTARILYQFRKAGFSVPRRMSVAWTYWIPLLGLMQHVVFWRAAVMHGQYLSFVASGLYLGAAIYALGGLPVLGGLVAYLYMVEVINFPHHLSMAQHEGEAKFPTYEQQHFTRSCIYPKWFARGVLLNFNLHTEHHLFPAHPWYQLDEIHNQAVQKGLLVNSCRANAWILENRSRPLVDVMSETFGKSEDKAA